MGCKFIYFSEDSGIELMKDLSASFSLSDLLVTVWALSCRHLIFNHFLHTLRGVKFSKFLKIFLIYIHTYKRVCVCVYVYLYKSCRWSSSKITSGHKDTIEVSQRISVQEGILLEILPSPWLWAFSKPNCQSSFPTKPPQHCGQRAIIMA